MTKERRSSEEETQSPETLLEGVDGQVQSTEAGAVPRRFTAPESLVTYSDYIQLARTNDEVILQFYVTVPGVPEGGKVKDAETRLVATVILNPKHAQRLGTILMSRASGDKT